MIIATALLLFGLKSVSIWTDASTLLAAVGPAMASEDPSPAESTEHVVDAHEEPEHAAPSHEEEMAHPGESSSAYAHDALASAETMSRSELEVLENLGARRLELDARERDLSTKESLMAAAEKRLDGKIDELRAIQSRIEVLLTKKDGEDAERIASLVKVYENMKAKDAARIFEKLEIKILLPVARDMKPQKVAAILAKMDALSAKQLTVELAETVNLSDVGG
jgi:flagellar motility protein MotE (MotC chaperone)